MLVLLTIAIGALVTLQAPLNARLGDTVGPVTASVVSFGVGLVALVAIATAVGQIDGIAKIGGVPWPFLTGGLIGATFVLAALVVVPELGAGKLTAGVIFGQLVAAVIVDRQGWFGVPQQDLTPTRIVGVVLLLAGVVLVTRR